MGDWAIGAALDDVAEGSCLMSDEDEGEVQRCGCRLSQELLLGTIFCL